MTTAVGLNYKTLSTLVDWQPPLLVSAFVPIDFAVPQPAEPIFKSLRRLAQMATTILTDQHGLTPGAAELFITPLLDESMLDDVPQASRGLAVFASFDRATHLALPITVSPAVEVGDHLDLLRLLPAVVDDVEFYALTIGKKGARLFRGSRFEFETVPVPNMPDSLDETLWYIRREPVRNRVGSGVLHGSGGGEDLRKDDVRQYIHVIDKAITPVLNGADAPLVVIGVEYETAMFINHTHYRHTVDIPILGSPESMSAAELHRRSWGFVGSHSRAADDAVKRLCRFAGTGKTATDPLDLVAASESGSIAELLVARSATNGGETRPLAVDERRAAVIAVNEALRHRATIHIVDDDSLPNGVRVAAILRY